MAITRCFKRIGFPQAELQYVTGLVEALKAEGMDEREAEVQAANDYMNMITTEQTELLKQVLADDQFEQPSSPDQTKTLPFKKWFKDSKVVDDQGKPLVVYHGTGNADIHEFDLGHPDRHDTGWLGTGVYLTTNPGIASAYSSLKKGGSPNVMPLYASLQNPYYATLQDKQRLMLVSSQQGKEAGRIASDEWTKQLKEKGHDGVIMDWKAETVGGGSASKEIIVFDTANVKSATGNRGTFDGTDPNILKQSSVKLRTGRDTLKKYGLDPDKSYTIREVAQALEKYMEKTSTVIKRGNHSDEAVSKVARWATEEVKFELLPENIKQSADEWYGQKMQDALDLMGNVFPELKTDKTARDTFTLILALASNGAKVYANLMAGASAYAYYKENGSLPVDTKAGQRDDAIGKGMAKVNQMFAEHGVEGTHQLLLAERKASDINKELRAAGEEPIADYKATEKVPYAVILGAKVGVFYANAMGKTQYLTMDRWLNRTVNRLRGDMMPRVSGLSDNPTGKSGKGLVGLAKLKVLMGKPDISDEEALKLAEMHQANYKNRKKPLKPGQDKPSGYAPNPDPAMREIEASANTLMKAALQELQDSPETPSEREFMIKVIKKVKANLKRSGIDTSVANIQALLWYYEKRLSNELGAKPSEAISYKEAAERYLKDNARIGASLRKPLHTPSEMFQSAVPLLYESGNRPPHPAQTAINRIRAHYARPGRGTDPGHPEASPGPYERGSTGVYSGNGLLTATPYLPEQVVVDQLFTIGAPAPVLYELTPSDAAAAYYHTQISAAKQSLKFGSSVYVYPAAEYLGMRLFVTADGQTGFALKGNDIVSVFSSNSAPKMSSYGGLLLAVQQGGRKLDCFDTILPDLYANYGFRAEARSTWNEDYKPGGWVKEDYKKYNLGEPDVVYMAYDPLWTTGYQGHEGVRVDDPDAAVALQDAAVHKYNHPGVSLSQSAVIKNALDSNQQVALVTPAVIAPVFYSQLLKVVSETKQESLTIEQWLALIDKSPGVKKDEVAFTGIETWLKAPDPTTGKMPDLQKEKVSRDDVVRYLKDNTARIKIINRSMQHKVHFNGVPYDPEDNEVEFGWNNDWEIEEPDESWIAENARDVWYEDIYEEILDRLKDRYVEENELEGEDDIPADDLKDMEETADNDATEDSERIARDSYYQDGDSPTSMILSVYYQGTRYGVRIAQSNGEYEIYSPELGMEGGFGELSMRRFDRPLVERFIVDNMVNKGVILNDDEIEEANNRISGPKQNIRGLETHKVHKHGNSNWSYPGGEAYHETTVTMPDQIQPYAEHDTTHFGDDEHGTGIFWLRADIRLNAKGEEVYFVQEMQSKRHMDARDKRKDEILVQVMAKYNVVEKDAERLIKTDAAVQAWVKETVPEDYGYSSRLSQQELKEKEEDLARQEDELFKKIIHEDLKPIKVKEDGWAFEDKRWGSLHENQIRAAIYEVNTMDTYVREDGSAAYNKTEEMLTVEYKSWMADNGLNLGSADEHLEDERLTPRQRAWLKDFSDRWDGSREGSMLGDDFRRYVPAERFTVFKKIIKERQALNDLMSGQRDGVPDAPFKKNWQLLAIKTAIHNAVIMGAKHVTWTPGKMQARRYSRTSVTDNITYKANEDGSFDVEAFMRGRSVWSENSIQPKKLGEWIGKDLVEKMVAGEGKLADEPRNKVIRKVGVIESYVQASSLQFIKNDISDITQWSYYGTEETTDGTVYIYTHESGNSQSFERGELEWYQGDYSRLIEEAPDMLIELAKNEGMDGYVAMYEGKYVLNSEGDARAFFTGNMAKRMKENYSNNWMVVGRNAIMPQLFDKADAIDYAVQHNTIGRENGIFSGEPPKTAKREFTGLELEVGGEGLIELYDSMFPKIAGEYIKKLGGNVAVHEMRKHPRGKSDTREKTSFEEQYHLQLGFTITPQMVDMVKNTGQMLHQGKVKDEDRGSITLLDNERIIKLGKSSDPSTFLHEAGHLFLEMEKVFAKKYGVSDTQEGLFKWLGIKSFDEIDPSTDRGRELHEKFARGFEAYLYEGKAPSLALRDAFSAFRRWLTRVYALLINKDGKLNLNVELNHEIRDVFDRLLASEEEIALAKANPAHQQFFRSKEQAGMTDEQWDKYVKKVTRTLQQAEQTLDEKLLKELTRQKTAEWKEEREPLIAEEKERLSKEPVYQVIKDITVDMLDYDDVLATLGVTTIPGRLKGKAKKGGRSVREYAEDYGFKSPRDMLEAIVSAPSLNSAAEEAAENRMKQKYGDILNDGSIEQEAREAVHNEEQAELLLMEIQSLNRKAKGKPINREYLKAQAKDMIGALKWSDIHPDRYYRQEIKAAQQAVLAKTEEAKLTAKIQQLANHYLYKEAAEAKRNIERYRKYIKDVQTRDYSTTQVEDRYVQNMKTLANMYDMRKSPEKTKSLDEFLNWYITQMDDPNEFIKVELLDTNLVLALEAKRRGELAKYDMPHYKDLTVDQLHGLFDMLKHLRYVGGQMANLEKAEFKANRDAGVNSIIDNGGKDVASPDEPQKGDDWLNSGKEFLLGFVHLRNLIRKLDGMKEDGWAYRNLFVPSEESSNAFLDLQKKMAERYKKEFDELHNVVFDKVNIVTQRKLNGGTWTLSSEGRIMLALYWGTESSRESIMLGHQVTEDDVMAMMGIMSKQELDLVNRIWRLNESLKSDISGLAVRMYGVAPVMLEPTPFEINGIKMTGGHMRLYYAGSVKELEANEEKLAATSPLSYSKPGTMHERVGSGGKKVFLDKSNIIRSLNENIHAITHAENFKSLARILNNKEIKDAIIRKHGTPFYTNLVESIQSDMGFKRDREHQRWLASFSRMVRVAATYKHLGFSIRNTLQQFSSIPVIINEIGYADYAHEMIQFSTNPQKYAATVREHSALMRNRSATVNREAADQLGKISESSAWNDLKQLAFFMQTTVDSLGAYPCWMARYKQSMSALSKDASTEKELQDAHLKAVSDADTAVAETIGSGLDRHLGQLFSSKRSEFVRMVTVFGSWFNAYSNRVYRDYNRADSVFDVQLFRTVVTTPIMTAMLAMALIGEGPDEDESWWLWGLKSYGSFMIALLPLIRDLAGAYKGFAPKTPAGSFAEAATRLPQEVQQYLKGNQTLLKTGSDMAKAITVFVPVPGAGQVLRMADYWDSYEQGKEGDFDLYQMITEGPTKR